jgi:hypothetical protein
VTGSGVATVAGNSQPSGNSVPPIPNTATGHRQGAPCDPVTPVASSGTVNTFLEMRGRRW